MVLKDYLFKLWFLLFWFSILGNIPIPGSISEYFIVFAFSPQD